MAAYEEVLLPWDSQPQEAVGSSDDAQQYLSNLYNFSQLHGRDLVGSIELNSLAYPSLYSFSSAPGGVGLSGEGVTAVAAAKGLFSGGTLAAGTNTCCGFGIVSLTTLGGSALESVLLRSTVTANSQGISLSFFPNTKTIRPLLSNVSWSVGNDRIDTRIVVDTPWFIGFWYGGGAGYVLSGPVGETAKIIGASFTTSTNSVTNPGPLYTGGSAYTSQPSPSFPGVIHAVGYSNKPVPLEWFQSIAEQPYSKLFAPLSIWVPVSAGGGPASQSIAFTLEDVSGSISQTLGHTQSAAATLDGVTVSASQTAGHGQSLTATLDDVVVTVNQSVGGANNQALAVTLDDVVVAASQTVGHSQALAVALDGVDVSINQSAASPVKSQSVAITLDDVSVLLEQIGRPADPGVVLLGGGPGNPRKRRELEKDSYLYRLLSPPIEIPAEVEPQAVEAIEKVADKVVARKAKPRPSDVAASLKSLGIDYKGAYRDAYQEVYTRMVQQKRQQLQQQQDAEDEEIVRVLAMML